MYAFVCSVDGEKIIAENQRWYHLSTPLKVGIAHKKLSVCHNHQVVTWVWHKPDDLFLLTLDCCITKPHQHRHTHYNTKSLSSLSSSLSLPYLFRRFFGFFLLDKDLENDFAKFLEEEVDEDEGWTGIFFLSEVKRWWCREDLGVWVLCTRKKNKHEFKLSRFYVTCFNWNYALTSNTFSTKLINNIVFRGKLVKIRFTARSFSFIPLIIIINGHIFVYRW